MDKAAEAKKAIDIKAIFPRRMGCARCEMSHFKAVREDYNCMQTSPVGVQQHGHHLSR